MSEEKKAVTEGAEATSTVHTPGAAIWRNQLVRVFERGTNAQVDTGLVTMVDGEKVVIHDQEYPKDKYDFQPLA